MRILLVGLVAIAIGIGAWQLLEHRRGNASFTWSADQIAQLRDNQFSNCAQLGAVSRMAAGFHTEATIEAVARALSVRQVPSVGGNWHEARSVAYTSCLDGYANRAAFRRSEERRLRQEAKKGWYREGLVMCSNPKTMKLFAHGAGIPYTPQAVAAKLAISRPPEAQSLFRQGCLAGFKHPITG